MVEYLLPELRLVSAIVQNQAICHAHRVVHDFDAGAYLPLNLPGQLHLPDSLRGGNVVAAMPGRLRADQLIGQLHGIVQVYHGGDPPGIGGNPSRLQRLQAHGEAGVVLCRSRFRHPVQMVESQNECPHALNPPVIAAHVLALGQGHRLESLGRRLLLLRHIVDIGIAEYLLG